MAETMVVLTPRISLPCDYPPQPNEIVFVNPLKVAEIMPLAETGESWARATVKTLRSASMLVALDGLASIIDLQLRFEGKLRDALHHAARLLVVQLTDEPGTTIRERWQSRWPDAVIGPQSLQLETASALSVLATLERDGVTVRSIEYGTSSLEAAYFHMRSTAASADQA